ISPWPSELTPAKSNKMQMPPPRSTASVPSWSLRRELRRALLTKRATTDASHDKRTLSPCQTHVADLRAIAHTIRRLHALHFGPASRMAIEAACTRPVTPGGSTMNLSIRILTIMGSGVSILVNGCGGGGGSNNVTTANLKPDFIMGTISMASYNGTTDDLATGGLGK